MAHLVLRVLGCSAGAAASRPASGAGRAQAGCADPLASCAVASGCGFTCVLYNRCPCSGALKKCLTFMREKKKICLILLYDESEIQTSRVSEKDIHGIQHVCIRVFCVHLFAQCAEARARVGRLAAR